MDHVMDVNNLSDEMVSRSKELCSYVLKKLMQAIEQPEIRKKFAKAGVYEIMIWDPMDVYRWFGITDALKKSMDA